MNKFLMLAIAAITLGLAVPAVAEDHAEGHTMAVEATTEAAADAVVAEVCMDDAGVEIECPAVEVEAAVEAEAEADADMNAAQ